MRIWLATVGEPLPMDGNNVRLLRTAQFAQWLSEQGHEVVFWTGTMDHSGRRLRSEVTTTTEVSPTYRIIQLAGRLYSRAVSFRRILNHRDVAREFTRHAPQVQYPDIILASYPTEELCRAILDYAEAKGIPVVIDVRDLWPDIFSGAFPKPVRFIAPLILLPFDAAARRVLRRATSITGPAKSMIKWGLAKAGRDWKSQDFWFPFTYPAPEGLPSTSDLPDFFTTPGADERLWFCFFGALSTRYNLEMVIDCFEKLDREGTKVSMVICGTGDAGDTLKKRAKNASNVFFPGWMNMGQIRAIMQRCDAGVFPYNTPDYFNNLPNKVCEYLAGGLPIVACTQGEVRNLIEETGCGYWHEPDSQAMADLVRRFVDEPELLARAAALARRTHATQFERQAVFETTLKKLDSIAKVNTRTRSEQLMGKAKN